MVRISILPILLSLILLVNAAIPTPKVDSVTPNTLVKAGTTLTIMGSYFTGINEISAKRSVAIGTYSCGRVKFIDDSTLTCYVSAGQGANQPVIVTVNGKHSDGLQVIDFEDTTSVGLTCAPPSGSQDRYRTDLCNCWSGFAPSDWKQTDCNQAAQCPEAISSPVFLGGSSTPSRPVSKFEDDKLYLTQSVPIALNRRSTNIKLVVPSNIELAEGAPAANTESISSCWYPGTMWTKSISERDCLDVFSAVIPWSAHGMCGFAQDNTTTFVLNSETNEYQAFVYYRSAMVTESTELFVQNGQRMIRSYTTTYLVSVSFVEQIVKVADSLFAVTIPDPTVQNFIDVVIEGDSLYNPSTGTVHVTFQTTLQWPYQIDSTTIQGLSWIPLSADQATGPVVYWARKIDINEDSCDSTVDTECVQQWEGLINIGVEPTCVSNLEGSFPFSVELLCRDGADGLIACPMPPTTLNFQLNSGYTDLCIDPTMATDASQGSELSITGFTDSAFTQQTDSFQSADFAYFRLSIVNPLASIDSISFNQIALTGANGADVIFSKDSSVTPADGVSFTKNEVSSIVRAGTPAALTFSFQLLRDKLVNTIGFIDILDPNGLQQPFTVETVIDIYYHGNQKRSVTATASLFGEEVVAHAERSRNVKSASSVSTISITVNASPKDVVQQDMDSLLPNESSASMSLVSFFLLAVLSLAYLF
eukprot:TRINITY_DN20_c0_g1_i10.p1 TRINITY_DN20_c0_g1~~TRINITY_DN20_c0_g1_i10.p1  ORF type:complete len:703 (+),score=130.67 TRINITY_DN20_c0_g1_i10:257-2365(+)